MAWTCVALQHPKTPKTTPKDVEQKNVHINETRPFIDSDFCLTHFFEHYPIGFHNGTSIRFDEWNGDAELAETDSFLELLSDLGFEKPLHDKLEAKRNMEADRVAERKWLDIAPRCFAKYWAEIKSLDDSFLPQLLEELNIEIPDKQKQIITLLQTFGRTENFWTYYPSYEELTNAILKTFDLAEIIDAYLNSDRNYKTRKGLGRFLCSSDLKKSRMKYLTLVTDEVISDLEKCFNHFGEKQGISEILKLKNEKKQRNPKYYIWQHYATHLLTNPTGQTWKSFLKARADRTTVGVWFGGISYFPCWFSPLHRLKDSLRQKCTLSIPKM